MRNGLKNGGMGHRDPRADLSGRRGLTPDFSTPHIRQGSALPPWAWVRPRAAPWSAMGRLERSIDHAAIAVVLLGGLGTGIKS